MSYWYVVKVLPGKEKQIQEQFNREIENGTLKFVKRFICPTEKNTVVVRNKKRTRESVIYTGYLYFESERLLNDSELSYIGSNNMIMSILGDRKPKRLRGDDVKKILKDESLNEYNKEKLFKFVPGEGVKITEGAFAGFNGTILEVNDKVVTIEVKIFGVGSKIKLKTTEISKNE